MLSSHNYFKLLEKLRNALLHQAGEINVYCKILAKKTGVTEDTEESLNERFWTSASSINLSSPRLFGFLQ